MRRFQWTAAAFVLLAAALVSATPAASPNFPASIGFPSGWAGEGIFGEQHTFWAGDTANGAIYKGDVKSGEGAILVPGATGKSAFGVFVDHWNRLWVAGGRTGLAYVYDADTGALITILVLAPPQPPNPPPPAPPLPTATFLNDVFVTRDAAFFTNTNSQTAPASSILFKVPLGQHGEIGTPTTVPVPFWGGNGIEATPDGKTLIVVSISQSKYYNVDAETGATEEIVLDQPAPRGDGLILHGHTLYAVLNLPSSAFPGLTGEISVIKLDDAMTTGQVVDHLNSPDDPLVNPATADLFGKYIYVVRRTAIGVSPVVRYLTRVDKNGDD